MSDTKKKYFYDAWYIPYLTIEDIAEETGLSHSTMRNWVDRGKIDLDATHKPGTGGKGMRTLYSMRDVTQFLLYAQLKRISSDIKLDEEMKSYIFGIIEGFLAESFKSKGIQNEKNVDRFIYIFYDGNGLKCSSSTKGDLLFERFAKSGQNFSDWLDEAAKGVPASESKTTFANPNNITGDVWTIIDAMTFVDTLRAFMYKHKDKLP